MVKCLSTMQETWVRALGWEDPLEKEMAIHSSTIAWKILWTKEPDRLQSMGSQRVRHDWVTSLSLFFFNWDKIVLKYCVNWLQFHPSHQNWFKWILFNGWVILHCIYVPQLSYPFTCWWTSRLLPCPGYYHQCCNEHWGTCVSFNSGFYLLTPLFTFFR